MRTSALIFAFMTLLVLPLIAQEDSELPEPELGREELLRIEDADIEFENYEGPYDQIDTLEQIRGIGVYLGRRVPADGGRVTYWGYYSVIRAYDQSVRDRLGADIFIIEEGALVDHIDNLRLMITGYLETAHGLSRTDAELIARFVTIYNAVFRGRMEVFEERYAPIVTENLDAGSAGLSRVWSDWAGSSHIVIPLRRPGTGEPSVTPVELVDEEVIRELRSRRDMGLEDRRAMVELLERELARLEEEIAAIEEEPEEPVEQPDVEEEPEEPVEEPDVEEEPEEPVEEPDVEEEPDEAMPPDEPDEPEEEAPEEEPPVEEPVDEPEEPEDVEPEPDEEPVEEPDEEEEPGEAAPLIDEAEDTEEALEELREGISDDQAELLDEEPIEEEEEPVVPVYFLETATVQGQELRRLVAVDPATGDVLQRSAEELIRSRELQSLGAEEFLVVIDLVGETSELAAIGVDNLEVRRRSEVEVHDDTLVSLRTLDGATEVFAVVQIDGAWHLGRFASNLALIERSVIEVNPRTSLTFGDEVVYVQSETGSIFPLELESMQVRR